jgi:ParB family chromosome partitioning protein
MSISAFWLLVSLCLPWIVFLGVVATSVSPSGPQIATKPLAWFILAPQVRKNYDDDDLRRLGESMKSFGQLQPVGAKPDGTVLWGHRRLLAARLVSLAALQVIITDRPLSDSEIRLIQLTENLHRADLSGYEKWMACSELMGMNPEWQMKDLAEHLHLDPSMVTRLLSPSKCITSWQEALAAGKVGISDCYAASKLGEAEQADLLTLKLSGASRDAIEQAGRKKRTNGTPAVKLARIKAVLPSSGVVIVASGEGLTLDDLIESLGEAQREAKKAREQGLDARTFQAVLRDKAKKR